MPFVVTDGVRHYYRLTGTAGRPVVMLSHSLGLDHGMWDPQAVDLERHFQVLRYDLRGHGASDAPAGEYSIEQLGRDALAIANALGVQTFAFCGLSIGGMIGQWIAAHAEARLTHLVLANTTSRMADPSAMEARRQTVLAEGMAPVTDAALGRFFSPAAVAAEAPQVVWARRTLLATDPAGYAGCCAAVRDLNQTSLLGSIRTPTLVISGDLDESMPWDGHGRVLSSSIPGAQAVRLPAAHISNLERPRSFTAALFDFLLPKAAGTVEAGMPIRRAAARRGARGPQHRGGHRLHPGLSGTDHPVRVGHDLGAARPRPSHAANADHRHHRGAEPLGGVPPARARRPRSRARAVRLEGSAAAGRGLRRGAGC